MGLIIRSDMKWSSNTEHIVLKAYKRLWILRRLLDGYIKQVRSTLELAVPAWHSGITVCESIDIERVQRAALQIILGMGYNSYNAALKYFSLDTIEVRIELLCKKFGNKAVKHPKHSQWFKPNTKVTETRMEQPKYSVN